MAEGDLLHGTLLVAIRCAGGMVVAEDRLVSCKTSSITFDRTKLFPFGDKTLFGLVGVQCVEENGTILIDLKDEIEKFCNANSEAFNKGPISTELIHQLAVDLATKLASSIDQLDNRNELLAKNAGVILHLFVFVRKSTGDVEVKVFDLSTEKWELSWLTIDSFTHFMLGDPDGQLAAQNDSGVKQSFQRVEKEHATLSPDEAEKIARTAINIGHKALPHTIGTGESADVYFISTTGILPLKTAPWP